MKEIVVEVPKSLDLTSTYKFVCKLQELEDNFCYIFDFEKTKRVEPFGMLFLSRELKKLVANLPNAEFQAREFRHLSYPGHMGFFKAFGLNFGNNPGEAPGSSRYIPITRWDVKRLRSEAYNKPMHIVDLIETKVERLAEVLSQGIPNIKKVLIFCLREIIRNIVEHSESSEIWFVCQYWSLDNSVEMCILDEGIGIYNSLKKNELLKFSNCLEAIKLSLEPGISSKNIEFEALSDNEYGNSGFGLHMTSSICKEFGDFVIGSGDKIVYLKNNSIFPADILINGTVLRLKLNLDTVQDLDSMLKKYRNTVRDGELLSASKISSVLKYK